MQTIYPANLTAIYSLQTNTKQDNWAFNEYPIYKTIKTKRGYKPFMLLSLISFEKFLDEFYPIYETIKTKRGNYNAYLWTVLSLISFNKLYN